MDISMSGQESIEEGFAVDNVSQRRRRVTGNSKKQVEEKIKWLETLWDKENKNLTPHAWQTRHYSKTMESSVLAETLNFPSPPSLPGKVKYDTIFLPLPLNTNLLDSEVRSKSFFSPVAAPHNTKLPNRAYLEDYANFCSSISDASKYRLAERISLLPEYPIPKPTIPTFPADIVKFRPMQNREAKWYDKLLFLRLVGILEQNSKAKEFNKWLLELQRDRQLFWKAKKEAFDKACHTVLSGWEAARSQWNTGVAADKAKLQELKSLYETGKANAVAEYFRTQMDSTPLPSWCPREYELEFDEEAGILLINVRLPYFGELEVMKNRELKLVPANQKEAREMANKFLFIIALRLIWEVPQVDYCNRVGMVACNGYVIFNDPSTGQRRQDVILSVLAKREDIKNIVLERIEPEACFRNLKGVAAAKISEIVPVQPLIQFNKKDKRFIAAKEVIDKMGDENLATMEWQDFEHLIRELFEKEFGANGAEVKITQASRDRGVDAIVFDPDPLRGGKLVIQAKRYSNTVDVSSVRDLYGTVMNEGANKGILVTTSNYGRDAYDFAKDKPLTLINGANLLHLLQKHGYHMKIDIKEAKRLLKVDQQSQM